MTRLLIALLLTTSLCGCAITSVASAAVSVASTAVSVTAKVVETTVDVGAAGVKAVTGSDAPKVQD
jgi:P pilus assembly chaperone PapD